MHGYDRNMWLTLISRGNFSLDVESNRPATSATLNISDVISIFLFIGRIREAVRAKSARENRSSEQHYWICFEKQCMNWLEQWDPKNEPDKSFGKLYEQVGSEFARLQCDRCIDGANLRAYMIDFNLKVFISLFFIC